MEKKVAQKYNKNEKPMKKEKKKEIQLSETHIGKKK